MKIRILDRILVALAGLMMLTGVAALGAQLFFGKDVVGRAAKLLANENLRLYIIIGGVLICLLGLYCVLMLFRHKGRKGKFVTQKTDSGELAISLKALESMVHKCLEQHKEVNAQSVSLENRKGSLLIKIRGTVAGGISIPLTVDTLQQQIKQYVTACSGVEVRDIRVEINSSGPEAKDAPFAIEAPAARGLLKENNDAAPAKDEPKAAAPAEPAKKEKTEKPASEASQEDELSAAAAAAAILMDKAPEEEDDRPLHQRLFSTASEPCVMPMPPVNRPEHPVAGAVEAKTEKAAEAPAEMEKPDAEEKTNGSGEEPAEKDHTTEKTEEGAENK